MSAFEMYINDLRPNLSARRSTTGALTPTTKKMVDAKLAMMAESQIKPSSSIRDWREGCGAFIVGIIVGVIVDDAVVGDDIDDEEEEEEASTMAELHRSVEVWSLGGRKVFRVSSTMEE